MFHHLFFKNIVTRTAIGKESLTALHLNCGEILWEIKLNFDVEKEEDYIGILVTTFNLD